MKAFVLINPFSGKKVGCDYRSAIEAKLLESFDKVETIIVENREEVQEAMAKTFKEKAEAVFSVGGDGTVNQIIEEIANRDSKIKLGIFPGGTVNDLARTIGISPVMEEAIENFTAEKTDTIDIGKINDKYFTMRVSIGTVSEALMDVSTEDKNKWGPMAYVFDSVKSFKEEKLYPLTIETEEDTFTGMISNVVIALKTSIHGIQFSNEEETNGKMSIFILGENTTVDKLALVGKAVLGEVEEHEKVRVLKGCKGRIYSKEGETLPTDVDGDEGPKLPNELEVLQEKIEVYIP